MELVTAKRVYALGFAIILVGVWGTAADLAVGQKVRGDERDLLIEFLGTNAPVVVSNGYVFLDHKYLPAPYRIQRIGQGVVINDILVNTLHYGNLPWTNEPHAVASTPIDPSMPSGIALGGPQYRAVLRGYVEAKKAYLFANHTPGDAKTLLTNSIARLPGVERIDSFASDVVLVHYKEGRGNEGFFVGMGDWRRAAWPSDADEFRRAVDVHMSDIRDRLDMPRDEAVFVLSQHQGRPLVIVAARWMAREFKMAMRVVFSSMDLHGKISELRKLKLHGIDSDEIAGAFISNCLKSDELRQRLGK